MLFEVSTKKLDPHNLNLNVPESSNLELLQTLDELQASLFNWPNTVREPRHIEICSIKQVPDTPIIEAYVYYDTSTSLSPLKEPTYKVTFTCPIASFPEPIIRFERYIPTGAQGERIYKSEEIREQHRKNTKFGNMITTTFMYNNFPWIGRAILKVLLIDSLIKNNSGEFYNIWEKVTGERITSEQLESLINQTKHSETYPYVY